MRENEGKPFNPSPLVGEGRGEDVPPLPPRPPPPLRGCLNACPVASGRRSFIMNGTDHPEENPMPTTDLQLAARGPDLRHPCHRLPQPRVARPAPRPVPGRPAGIPLLHGLADSAGMPAESVAPARSEEDRTAEMVSRLETFDNTIQYSWLMEAVRELFAFRADRLTAAMAGTCLAIVEGHGPAGGRHRRSWPRPTSRRFS